MFGEIGRRVRVSWTVYEESRRFARDFALFLLKLSRFC